MLNRICAPYIWQNLDFPCSSCIAIKFLGKQAGVSCVSSWLLTSLVCFLAMSLLDIQGNAMATNSPWSLNYGVLLRGSWITQRFMKKSTACLLIQHFSY